jgi:hypothetical protein
VADDITLWVSREVLDNLSPDETGFVVAFSDYGRFRVRKATQ